MYKPSKEVYQLILDEFNQEKDKYIFFQAIAGIFTEPQFWLKNGMGKESQIDDNLPGKPDFIINKLNDHKINKI